MKLRRLALILLPVLVFVLAAPAWAEGEEGAGGDLKARIKKKMEGILELMKQNEAALLKLSTGQAAETKKVDVEVPDQPPSGAGEGAAGGAEGASGGAEGAGGAKGAGGASGGAQGSKEIGKKLDELIRGVRSDGGKIPDELKQLVEMIPL